jgi:DNA polymerase-3 subunit beta
MQIKIQQSQLSEALKLISKAVSQNNIIPAASCIRFKTDGNQLELSSCNMQVSMQTTIPCEATENNDGIIQSGLLIETISSLAGQSVTFNIDGGIVTIIHNSGTCEMPIEPGGDFPKIIIDTDKEAKMQSADLFEAIYSTAYARYLDETNLKFTGLQVDFAKDNATFVACNLVLLSAFNVPGKFKPGGLLMPKHVTDVLASLTFQSECTIKYSDKSIGFEFENGLIIKSMLIDDKYPDWRSIVPKNDIMCTVNRAELVSSLKRVIKFSPIKIKIVSIYASAGKFEVQSSDMNMKQSAKETINANMTTDLMINININGGELIAALSHMDSENVTFLYSNQETAMLIKEDLENENFVSIMPLKV